MEAFQKICWVLLLHFALFPGIGAKPDYYPSGVKLNVSVSTVLAGGWTVCHDAKYSSPTTASSIDACKAAGSYVLMGARSSSTSSTFALLAAGESQSALAYTNSTSTAYYENGAYWYYYSSNSVGFAGSSAIDITTADNATANCEARLSWRLGGGKGYRAGCDTALSTNGSWRKVMYYSNDTATDVPTQAPSRAPTQAPTLEITPQPTVDYCDYDYMGYCYTIQGTSTGASYTTAVSSCEDINATIASITSQAEMLFIWEYVMQYGSATSLDAYIGFTDEASEGNFVWEDGSTNSYTNWDTNQPDNGGGPSGSDCTVVQSSVTASGKWSDVPCLFDNAYICKWEEITKHPTLAPTISPSLPPSLTPTLSPTLSPTLKPTLQPSLAPTVQPTIAPSLAPTPQPTRAPTLAPTLQPTLASTMVPTPEYTGTTYTAMIELTLGGVSSADLTGGVLSGLESAFAEITGVNADKITASSGSSRRRLGDSSSADVSIEDLSSTQYSSAESSISDAADSGSLSTTISASTGLNVSSVSHTITQVVYGTTLAPTEAPTLAPTTGAPTTAPTLFPTVDAPEATSADVSIAALNVTAVTETEVSGTYEVAFAGTLYYYAAKASAATSVVAVLSRADPVTLTGATQGTFALSGLQAGTDYKVHAYVEDTSGAGAAGVISRSFTTAPSPPALSSAKFSSAGAKITVSFDSATDQGSTIDLDTVFDCSDLLDFPGYSDYCEWTSKQKVTVYLTSSSSALPGDTLSVAADALKAYCTGSGLLDGCAAWAYSSNTSATIATADDPLEPTLVLSYGARTSSCSDLAIDASGSTGSGYASLVFGWSLISASSSGDTSTIQTVLDSYGTSASSITIQSKYVPAGNYSFLVNATNFLGGTASSLVEIEVVNQSVPTLLVDGSSSYTILRSEAFTSLSASATITKCNNGTSTAGISYSWSVEEDSSISSYSADPRAFKVNAHAFEVGTYTLTCTATTTGGSSSTSVSLTVKEAGLNADISGAAVQTVTLSGAIGLDGSGSSDLNEADGALLDTTSYMWSCLDSGGSVCSFLPAGATGDYLNLTGLGLETGDSYYFTLVIEEGSRSSNDTVKVKVVSDPIPEIVAVPKDSSIELTKVDPSSVFVLKGYVEFGENVAYTQGSTEWSLVEDDSSTFSSGTIEDVASSGLSLSFSKGVATTHYLVIPADEMVAGGTYVFQFDGSYTGSASTSTSQVTVTCNEPPSSGSLTVSPESGQSITDTFDLTSSGWSDDADDFPLRYNFFYYDEDEDNRITVLKLFSYSNKFEDAYLMEGYGSNATLTLGTKAKDAYDAVGLATFTATVTAYEAELADAGAAADAIVGLMLDDLDVENLHAALQSFSAFVGARNCTLAPDCTALNREACEDGDIDHECGACLSGYVGHPVDVGSQCEEAPTPPASCYNGARDWNETDVDCGGACGPTCGLGAACLGPGDCELRGCFVGGTGGNGTGNGTGTGTGNGTAGLSYGVCQAPPKRCGYNCSDRGDCEYYGPTGLAVDSCLAGDEYCSAVCSCRAGWYGDYCTMTEEQYLMKQEITAALVSGLETGLGYADSDADSLEAGSATVFSLSSNVAMLNSSSQLQILNMTMSLINSSLASGTATSTSFAGNGLDVMYNILSGTDLGADADAMDSVSAGISNLAVGAMALLVAGQDAQESSSGGVAFSAQILDLSSLDSTSTLNAPSSDDYSGTSVGADLGSSFSGETSVGVSASSFSFNPYSSLTGGSSANISSTVGRLGVDGLTSLLATGANLTFEMTLPNYFAQTYDYGNTSTVQVECSKGDYSTYTIPCGSQNITYSCPGTKKGSYDFNCTTPATVPSCVVWDGDEWSDEICSVKYANATQTVCKCTYDAEFDSRRRLNEARRLKASSAETSSIDVASDVSSIGNEIAANFAGFTTPFTDPSVIADNWVVFTVMGCMFAVGPFLIILSNSLRWLYLFAAKRVKTRHSKYSELRTHALAQAKTSFNKSMHKVMTAMGMTHLQEHALNYTHTRCGQKIPLRIYGKGDRTKLFWSKWVEDSEWIQLMLNHEDMRKRIEELIVMLAFLFTLMCWDATLTPVFGSSDNSTSSSTANFTSSASDCSDYTSRTQCNTRVFSSGCYWDTDENTCTAAGESIDGVVLTLYCSVLSIILSTPMLILVEFVLSKTIYLPYPPKEGDDSGNESCSEDSDDHDQLKRKTGTSVSRLCSLFCCTLKKGSTLTHQSLHQHDTSITLDVASSDDDINAPIDRIDKDVIIPKNSKRRSSVDHPGPKSQHVDQAAQDEKAGVHPESADIQENLLSSQFQLENKTSSVDQIKRFLDDETKSMQSCEAGSPLYLKGGAGASDASNQSILNETKGDTASSDDCTGGIEEQDSRAEKLGYAALTASGRAKTTMDLWHHREVFQKKGYMETGKEGMNSELTSEVATNFSADDRAKVEKDHRGRFAESRHHEHHLSSSKIMAKIMSDPRLRIDVLGDDASSVTTEEDDPVLEAKVRSMIEEQKQYIHHQNEKKPWLIKTLFPSVKDKVDIIEGKRIRRHAVRALALENQIKDWLEKDESMASEALLLRQAHWDYMGSNEKRSLGKLTEELHGLEEEEEEDDTGLSYRQTKIRHIAGGIFMTGYLFITGYYVCLFGINYGAEYTNNWLGSFFIALSQEIALYIPLRVFIWFCVLPSMASPRIYVRRLQDIQPRCPSWQVARACPELASSQLIMYGNRRPGAGSSGQLRIMFGKQLSKHWFVGRDQDKGALFWLKAKAAVLGLLSFPLLYAPAVLAETALDTFIAIGANYMTLFLYLIYLVSGVSTKAFGAALGIVFFFALAAFFISTQPRQRKALMKWVRQKILTPCSKKVKRRNMRDFQIG